MDLHYSDEDLAFRDEVRRFIAAHLPDDVRAHRRDGRDEFIKQDIQRWQAILHARGWAAPGWPEAFGGTGWNKLRQFIFETECALADAPPPGEAMATQAYTLVPYEELEHLPLGDGRFTSMFYDNGLVRGAQRAEGIFFTPIGILSAGQPRQRGTQLIHWDHWDFDDPHLFEKTLRLPGGF